MKIIGVDNGITGSIAVLEGDGHLVLYAKTPVIRQLNYTKTKAWIHRVDHEALGKILETYAQDECRVALERPMVMPGRFKATISAIRALESTQIILERLKMPYRFIDSKEWQRVMLPAGLKGEELKEASTSVCARIFPNLTIKHHGDGDSLLIAEYLRRTA